jgi:hypothetical protein
VIDGVVANMVVVDSQFTFFDADDVVVDDDGVDKVTINFAFDLYTIAKHGYGAQIAR